MDYAKLVIPRPLRDVYSQCELLKDSETKTVDNGSQAKQFLALTVERLLLSCLGAGAFRSLPKWAAYGATAVLSLPAAIALGATELVYRGLSSFALSPVQLVQSALLLGVGFELFENYDRVGLDLYSLHHLHLRPEPSPTRASFNGDVTHTHGRYWNFKRGEISPAVYGGGVFEPLLMSVNFRCFSQSTTE